MKSMAAPTRTTGSVTPRIRAAATRHDPATAHSCEEGACN